MIKSALGASEEIPPHDVMSHTNPDTLCGLTYMGRGMPLVALQGAPYEVALHFELQTSDHHIEPCIVARLTYHFPNCNSLIHQLGLTTVIIIIYIQVWNYIQ